MTRRETPWWLGKGAGGQPGRRARCSPAVKGAPLCSVSELSEAADLFRDVLAINPETRLDHARWLSNLSITLLARYERSGATADLDEAITTIRQAVIATTTAPCTCPTSA